MNEVQTNILHISANLKHLRNRTTKSAIAYIVYNNDMITVYPEDKAKRLDFNRVDFFLNVEVTPQQTDEDLVEIAGTSIIRMLEIA